MKLRLLIVEDDENNISLFEAELKAVTSTSLTIARSRDSAIAALSSSSYDLVILDLAIPTTDFGADPDENHGMAVWGFLENNASGSQVLFFTGHETVKFVKKILSKAKTHDCWGTGKDELMTDVLEKGEFAECIARIKRCDAENRVLSGIDISSGISTVILTDNQKKILRIFARIHQGHNIRITKLAGGLSHALTCRIEVQGNQQHAVTSYAVVKLGTLKELHIENYAVNSVVSPVILPGGFAPLFKFIQAGAANMGGIFYSLAVEHDWSLFDALKNAPETTKSIVDRLRIIERPWQASAAIKTISVSELRRSMIDDDKFETIKALLPFDYNAVETASVRVTICNQHRDLHGLNILLRNRTDPLLIDFGEVGEAPACLDPIIMELSLLFHPTCKTATNGWPTHEQAAHWNNLSHYVGLSPLKDFIYACREWACDVEKNDRARSAAVYAFAVRQLKFDGTDHNLAIIIAGVAARVPIKRS
jgi:CheY-like chemotaxis protein